MYAAANTARDGFRPNPKAKLKDQFHEVARFKHLSLRSEEAYWGWVVRFLKFHRVGPAERQLRPTGGGWRHPREISGAGVSEFLSHLATERGVAAATQNQALNALIFLYREVLHVQVGEIEAFERAKRPVRLPVVLSKGEVKRLLAVVGGEYALPVRLLYGTGMRLMELLRLRIKDLDFERNQVVVRDGRVNRFAPRDF